MGRKMEERLTAEEMEAVKAGRIKEREKRWNNLFSRYSKDGDLDDVVIWEDDYDEGDGDKMPENGNLDAADNNNDQDDLCIEVSDDDEEQKEFLNVFQKCAQERIESVQQVYEKHTSEETMTKDGYQRRSESILHKGNRTSETKVFQSGGKSRRSLAPKSLTYGFNGINEHRAINGSNSDNNRCLDLARPMHSFQEDESGNGIISAMNQSITQTPFMQKDGNAYLERTVTTTTTTTTTVTEKVMIPTAAIPNSPYLPAIETIDVDDDYLDVASPTKKYKTQQSIVTTPKTSNRSSRSSMRYAEYSSTGSDDTTLKGLSYLQIAVTPKSLSKRSASRLSIAHKSHIQVSGKDLQNSVKAMCPTADIDRLKKRQLTSDGPNQSFLVECTPKKTPAKETASDFLYRLKNTPTALAAKQILDSSERS